MKMFHAGRDARWGLAETLGEKLGRRAVRVRRLNHADANADGEVDKNADEGAQENGRNADEGVNREADEEIGKNSDEGACVLLAGGGVVADSSTGHVLKQQDIRAPRRLDAPGPIAL